MVYPIVVKHCERRALLGPRRQRVHRPDHGLRHESCSATRPDFLVARDAQPDRPRRGGRTAVASSRERSPSLLCEFSKQERAAFASSGSEAVLAAVRLARTVTGRTRIGHDQRLPRHQRRGAGSRQRRWMACVKPGAHCSRHPAACRGPGAGPRLRLARVAGVAAHPRARIGRGAYRTGAGPPSRSSAARIPAGGAARSPRRRAPRLSLTSSSPVSARRRAARRNTSASRPTW